MRSQSHTARFMLSRPSSCPFEDFAPPSTHCTLTLLLQRHACYSSKVRVQRVMMARPVIQCVLQRQLMPRPVSLVKACSLQQQSQGTVCADGSTSQPFFFTFRQLVARPVSLVTACSLQQQSQGTVCATAPVYGSTSQPCNSMLVTAAKSWYSVCYSAS
jgi:hypothetical protein